ncbi:MAG: histidine kinase dimerization/phosphoacceptor domain -containing protein [Pseudomonadota bacterium]
MNPIGVTPEQADDLGELEFRELADNAPVMIWRAGADKLCDWFNKPWQVFAGKSLEQLLGYGWAEDVHPEDLERCVSIYESAFDARTTFTMPYRLRRNDGEYRWFLDNGAPFYRNGVFAGYFGSCVDITEQRDIQEHQRVLLAELNHRVKNNLQLIISFLQLSKIRAEGDEAKALMQAAISRVYGVGVVQDELHKHKTGLVDLGEYLPDLARTLLNVESAGAATLEARTQCVRVPFQLASNLGLIVNELMINAIKHGQGATGTVRLQVLQPEPDLLEIAVGDSGDGFSPAMLALDAPPAAVRGLGLIDALARRCNARVERSNQNGARVRLVMPIPALPASANEHP